MSSPRVLCLLAALLAVTVAQGKAASCYQCKSSIASGCSDATKTCPVAQSACLSVWEANTLVKGAVENRGTFYSCIPSSILSRNISLFFGNGLYVKIQSQVCSVDGCNAQISPVFPAIDAVYNGGWCPTCFAPGQSSCSSNGTLPCEGRANQCISINGEMSEDDITIPFAAQGCATPDACTLEKGVVLDSGVFTYKITQAICHLPSSAVQSMGPFILSSIIPSLAGVLVVKFLS